MKPASFEYLAPDSLDAALEALARHGWDAKLLAGGQSLIPVMSFRLAQPAVLIDLINKNLITKKVALQYSPNPEQLKMNMQGIYLGDDHRILG